MYHKGPNQTQGRINLDFTTSASSVQMRIFSSSGRLVYKTILGTSNGQFHEKLDLSSQLMQGVYSMKLNVKGATYVKKLEIVED